MDLYRGESCDNTIYHHSGPTALRADKLRFLAPYSGISYNVYTFHVQELKLDVNTLSTVNLT